MKKTKVLAALLAASMVLAGISGCSQNTKGSSAQSTASGTDKSAEDTSADSADGDAERSGKGAEDGTAAQEKAPESETNQSDGSDQGMQESEENGEGQEAKGGNGSGAGDEVHKNAPNPPAEDGSRILFVGNSHTYTNELPSVFAELAEAGGHMVDVYNLTEGSYSLKRYSDPEDELGAVLTGVLQEEQWDFVVLQENTNAAISVNAKKDMYPYARQLDEMIHNAGGQTVFLMTWAPKDGAGVISHDMVQSMLSSGYRIIAQELDALLIPGGDVFSEALKTDESLELWGDDGEHPSLEGTYLAACTAYSLFFQESPVGNTFTDGLEDEAAAQLQEIAQSYMMGNSEQ